MTSLDNIKKRAEIDSKSRGYYLTPDLDLLKDLLNGLRINEERYGYPSCPCRMATGNFELDRDIICPCDYRDIDVEEYGSCFCSLYVDNDIYDGRKEAEPIPERRPIDKLINVLDFTEDSKEIPCEEEAIVSSNKRQFYFCKVCGYVVFRDDPPYVCPICRAKKKMFSIIKHKLSISVEN